MPATTPALPHRRRWVRRPGVWVLAVLLAALGWGGWREYDFRCAVREARAAALDFRMDESPLGQIRGDWHAAFDKDTWTDRERRLIVPDSRDLAPLRPLLHRLGPTVLQVSDGQHLEALQGLTELKRIFLPECAALQNVDALRGHTVLATAEDGSLVRVICGYCGSQHNYRGGAPNKGRWSAFTPVRLMRWWLCPTANC